MAMYEKAISRSLPTKLMEVYEGCNVNDETRYVNLTSPFFIMGALYQLIIFHLPQVINQVIPLFLILSQVLPLNFPLKKYL